MLNTNQQLQTSKFTNSKTLKPKELFMCYSVHTLNVVKYLINGIISWIIFACTLEKDHINVSLEDVGRLLVRSLI